LQSTFRYYKLSKEEKERLIKRLNSILREHEEILLAVLYGSFIELDQFRDIDIAVYIPRYDLNALFSISNILEESLQYPVDITPLQEIPPEQRLRLLTHGLIIIERIPGLYEALIKQSLDEITLMNMSGNV